MFSDKSPLYSARPLLRCRNGGSAFMNKKMFWEGHNRSELLRIGQNRSEFQGFEISNLKFSESGPRSMRSTRKRGAEGGVGDARLCGTREVQGRLGSGRSGSVRRPAAVRRFSASRRLSGRSAIVGFISIFSMTTNVGSPRITGRATCRSGQEPRLPRRRRTTARRAAGVTGAGCGPNRLPTADVFAGARRTKFFVTCAKIA
jgi:hypothetical protein